MNPLDEPTAGIDPQLRVAFWNHFRQLAREGVTLVISSHVMDEAERCDRLGFLRAGRLLAEGTPGAKTTTLEETFLRYAGGDQDLDAGPANHHPVPAGQANLGPAGARGLRRPQGKGPHPHRRGQRGDERGSYPLGRYLRSWFADGEAKASPWWSWPARRSKAYIREGEIKAALLFPANFTLTLLRERQVKLDLVLEGSDPADSAAILRNLGQVLMAVSPRLARPGVSFQAESIKIEPHYLYGRPEFDALDYLAPVVIPLFAFVLVFLLTCLSFLRERAQGTLERMIATPIGRKEIILGYMLGFGFFAIAQSLLIVFVVEAILVVGAVNLGIFLPTFTRTEFQVVQFMPLVIVPHVLLSGTFWAVEEMPKLLRGIAYANRALRRG